MWPNEQSDGAPFITNLSCRECERERAKNIKFLREITSSLLNISFIFIMVEMLTVLKK